MAIETSERAPKESYVKRLFASLENGKFDAFFDHVAEDVSWTVIGSHPMQGIYHTKDAFIETLTECFDDFSRSNLSVRVENLLFAGDIACVDMELFSTSQAGQFSLAACCWIVRFVDKTIVEVRTYVDLIPLPSRLSDIDR